MNITYSKELAEYMKRKGYHTIEISMAESGTDTSGYAEVTAMPLKTRAADKIREKALRVIHVEGLGEILIMSRGMEYDPEVHLGLTHFLGIKHVSVKGIRAFSLR